MSTILMVEGNCRKQSVDIGTGIGIALYPADTQDADALIKAADAAVYSAKQVGSSYRLCGTQARTAYSGQGPTRRAARSFSAIACPRHLSATATCICRRTYRDSKQVDTASAGIRKCERKASCKAAPNK